VRWTIIRDENKYARMSSFARALPALRRRIRRDLAKAGLSKRKVLATVVQLLNDTLIRVGNEEYARDNNSYGLTTFLSRHAKVTSNGVRFRFRGKSGKVHEVRVFNKRLARIVRQCQELPGSQLFQYVSDTGDVHDITSTDVNAYLRSAMGRQFTAKDFRTWAGTLLAARTLASMKLASSKTARERSVVQAIDTVAEVLGNTRSICRKCYVHPAILAAFMQGRLGHGARAARNGSRNGSISEAEVLAMVRRNGRAKM
jgi:DNA topoisomerase I